MNEINKMIKRISRITVFNTIIKLVIVIALIVIGVTVLVTHLSVAKVKEKVSTLITGKKHARNLSWGMGRKQVIQIEGKDNIETDFKDSIVFDIEIEGFNSSVECHFIDNKLVKVRISVVGISKDNIDIYRSINSRIKKKYEIKKIFKTKVKGWRDYLYVKGNEHKLYKEILAGKTNKIIYMRTKESIITSSLFLYSEDYIKIYVTYFEKDYYKEATKPKPKRKKTGLL